HVLSFERNFVSMIHIVKERLFEEQSEVIRAKKEENPSLSRLATGLVTIRLSGGWWSLAGSNR
ncbi:hypothetical protein, partial [Halomonas koreensis]